MCQWYNFCLPEANEKRHLSLVPGVNRKIKESLEKISVKNYADLANCTKEDFNSIEELAGEKGKGIILQAKSLTEKTIYLKSLPNISSHNSEVFIDFESDMFFDEKGTELRRIDYLIGLLKKEGNKWNYTDLLLEENEEQLLNDFTAYLRDHMDCTFYHYGHYEQSIFENKWESLPKVKLVNMEKVVKDSVIIPVTGYSLKNIAKFLGFRWKNKEASATQSMCWYSNYLETKDRKYLDMSIQYNEDDCRALLYIKDWLENIRKNQCTVEKFYSFDDLQLPIFND